MNVLLHVHVRAIDARSGCMQPSPDRVFVMAPADAAHTSSNRLALAGLFHHCPLLPPMWQLIRIL